MSEENIYKTNLLKCIFTRIDYEDISEVSGETIKKIKNEFPESELKTRMLNLDDFKFSDKDSVVNLPDEVIRKTVCKALLFKDENLIIEINQYFVRIIYEVNQDNYKGYNNSILRYVVPILKILVKEEKLNIKRISVNKVDTGLYNSLTSIRRVFKSSILRNDLFKGKINWREPQNRMEVKTNFKYLDYNINFASILQRIKVNKDYLGLILDYEVYIKKNILEHTLEHTEVVEVLKELNKICDELFFESLTPKGLGMLEENLKLDDYKSLE